MQSAKRMVFDVGIAFIASEVTLSLGFVITVGLCGYLGAGNFWLYRMTFYDLRDCTACCCDWNSCSDDTIGC